MSKIENLKKLKIQKLMGDKREENKLGKKKQEWNIAKKAVKRRKIKTIKKKDKAGENQWGKKIKIK